ncbi:hypothetical protein [Borborobacter arsenicus]|uniref:hypothetical protein n=1 Tax=Borborobacter arsenicus TaxID=1851146 RepID=UPI001404F230|nr:hypothetical protein [Pseudaminobacter arsenicus]
MLTETTRTKTMLVIMLLAVVAAITAVVTVSNTPIQALIFCAMAATAAIFSALLVVAVN